MIHFIDKCKNSFKLFEEIETDLDKQLAIFVETNVALTNWYIENSQEFINFVKNSLIQYDNNNFVNWNIDVQTGISLKKQKKTWPNLELSLYNNNNPSIYYSKTETIFLNLLDNNLKIPQFIIYNLQNNGVIIQNILVHELTHYYDDMMLKGNGRKLKVSKNYYSTNEINAYTKQIIHLMLQHLTPVMNSILVNSDKTLQEEFNHIMHELLNMVMSINRDTKIFIDNLNEKNRKHIYKEIGLYFKKYFTDNYFLLNMIAKDNYDLDKHNAYWKKKSNV